MAIADLNSFTALADPVDVISDAIFSYILDSEVEPLELNEKLEVALPAEICARGRLCCLKTRFVSLVGARPKKFSSLSSASFGLSTVFSNESTRIGFPDFLI